MAISVKQLTMNFYLIPSVSTQPISTHISLLWIPLPAGCLDFWLIIQYNAISWEPTAINTLMKAHQGQTGSNKHSGKQGDVDKIFKAGNMLNTSPPSHHITEVHGAQLWALCMSQAGIFLIPAWISNHMSCNVWDEITYPFLNLNGCTVEV